MLGLAGCISSPSSNLAVETLTSARTEAETTTTSGDQVVAANPAQDTGAALQVAADQSQNNPSDIETVIAQAEQPGVVMQPTTIAATKGSIFAVQGQPSDVQPLIDTPAFVPVPGANPSKTSLYAVSTQVAVEQPAQVVQPPLMTDDGQIPGAEAAKLPLTAAGADSTDDDAAAAKTRSIAPIQGSQEAKQPKKKKLTLSDFFKNKKTSKNFDSDRFGKNASKQVAFANIGGMKKTVSDTNALPGVRASAMFPTNNLSHDEQDENDSDGLVQTASLSGMMRLAPNGLLMQTEKVEIRCLRPELVNVLKSIEAHYQRPVIVTSGFRDTQHNRQVGGARGSMHTLCAAADIQVEGVTKWKLAEYLRSMPGRGGVGTYCHTESVHIDVGSERDWNWRCRRKKKRNRA